MKDSFENFMKELTEEQKQLISPQISQTNQNAHLKSEDTELTADFDGYSDTSSDDTGFSAHIESKEVNFDDHLETPCLQPIRLRHIF